MRFGTMLALLMLAAAVAGCSGKSTESSASASGAGMQADDGTSGTGPAGGSATSHSSTTTGASGSGTTTGTGSTGPTTTSGPSGANTTAPKPTPVSVTCQLQTVSVMVGGSASCGSGWLVSDTGGAFTVCVVTFTFSGAAPNATFGVLDGNGTVLATATGTTSPVALTVPPAKVPAVAQFSLTGQMTVSGATAVAQGSVRFDLS